MASTCSHPRPKTMVAQRAPRRRPVTISGLLLLTTIYFASAASTAEVEPTRSQNGVSPTNTHPKERRTLQQFQCQDNPDYQSKMGMTCDKHETVNCAAFIHFRNFDQEDVDELLHNCPKACNACDKIQEAPAEEVEESEDVSQWQYECKDNPDFRSKMLMACDKHETVNCAAFINFQNFDQEDVDDLLRNCPKACKACPDIQDTEEDIEVEDVEEESVSKEKDVETSKVAETNEEAETIDAKQPTEDRPVPTETLKETELIGPEPPAQPAQQTPTTIPIQEKILGTSSRGRGKAVELHHSPEVLEQEEVLTEPSLDLFESMDDAACHSGWDPLCADDPQYVSKLGFRCDQHVNVDCTGFSRLGFTEREVYDLVNKCPCSCRIPCGSYTLDPALMETVSPTSSPTEPPTPAPVTSKPTQSPSASPATESPTSTPSSSPVTSPPTLAPVTPVPSAGPTKAPVTPEPSDSPTPAPVTPVPSAGPTKAPVTPEPSDSPTPAPVTPVPSAGPTKAPVTPEPSDSPTPAPVTPVPSAGPTKAPVTPEPSDSPTSSPTISSSSSPSVAHSSSPSFLPTTSPVTPDPTPSPTVTGSSSPSAAASDSPSSPPSTSEPSNKPTATISSEPSVTASFAPSTVPTAAPITVPPTANPSGSPVTSPPSKAPITSEPTSSPVTSPPSKAPITSEPTASPVTASPSASPVTPAPTDSPVSPAPTEAPVTPAPSKSPVSPAPTRPEIQEKSDLAFDTSSIVQPDNLRGQKKIQKAFSDHDGTGLNIAWEFEQSGLNADGGWSVSDDGMSVKFNVEDSSVCVKGGNTKEQSGKANGIIMVFQETMPLHFAIGGMGEMLDEGYESLTLALNGVVIASATSKARGVPCSSGPAQVTYHERGPIYLPSGMHTISLQFTTFDDYDHQNVFYELDLSRTAKRAQAYAPYMTPPNGNL